METRDKKEYLRKSVILSFDCEYLGMSSGQCSVVQISCVAYDTSCSPVSARSRAQTLLFTAIILMSSLCMCGSYL